jgi:hypothetical protein
MIDRGIVNRTCDDKESPVIRAFLLPEAAFWSVAMDDDFLFLDGRSNHRRAVHIPPDDGAVDWAIPFDNGFFRPRAAGQQWQRLPS